MVAVGIEGILVSLMLAQRAVSLEEFCKKKVKTQTGNDFRNRRNSSATLAKPWFSLRNSSTTTTLKVVG